MEEEKRRGITRKDHRFTEEDTGDMMECSGKYCVSCTAGLIADGVAICCCPCAIVSFFVLTFFKAPWAMGRRCLGLGKKKGRRLKNKGKCERRTSDCCVVVEDIDGISRKGKVELGTVESVTGFEDDEEQECNLSVRSEAERVWLELYQLGHLGFGRVSFHGISS